MGKSVKKISLAKEFWLVNTREPPGSELYQIVFDSEEKAQQWIDRRVDAFGYSIGRADLVNLDKYLKIAISESNALDHFAHGCVNFSKLLWAFLFIFHVAPFFIENFSGDGFWFEQLGFSIAAGISYLGYRLNKYIISKEIYNLLKANHKRLWEYDASGCKVVRK